jgi:cellulose biosynthesis protein BcsQ
MLEDEPSDIDVTEEIEEAEENPTIQPSDSRDGSMNREAKEHQEKKWEEAKKAELKEKESKKKAEDAKREGEQAKRKEEEQQEAAKDSEKDENASSDDVPLKGDPEFAKYFKMLKMGMPKEQILHAMTRDEKDVLVLDLDPNKSLKSQTPEEPKSADGDVPLKDDPEYLKYFKMLKMGLPVGAVKNALTKDGKDPTIMDLDPNKSLKSQRQAATNGDDGPPLKEDPDYVKYFKMLKMGLPLGAVKNALTKDGKDPSIMDLDPNKSRNSQVVGEAGSTADDGPPLKDDPEYSKYFKMLGMGLPIGAVKNAVVRDDKDPAIMDLDPNKSVKSQMGGVDAGEDTGPPLKEDPEYVKYFKMLTMGLPMGAVKNAVSRDGKDPAMMDLDPHKSLKSQIGGGDEEEKDTGIPLKDDPEYAKYFKMMGMGLPPGAVKNAIERDGKNAAVIDLDPNKSVAFQMKKKAGSAGKKPAKKKKRVRRKKIYWNPIDPGKIKEDSMWNIVQDSIRMDKLNYDVKEFEDLFTESADPADQKKEKKGPAKAAKKLVQVIEGKRDMNGGIVLARLKTEYSKIAEFVDKM